MLAHLVQVISLVIHTLNLYLSRFRYQIKESLLIVEYRLTRKMRRLLERSIKYHNCLLLMMKTVQKYGAALGLLEDQR